MVGDGLLLSDVVTSHWNILTPLRHDVAHCEPSRLRIQLVNGVLPLLKPTTGERES